ncbi:MAG: hypothetical protein HY682_01620 [Chloroflexi bacterium]|nr:hypothetical protein [Chloroflexota bacterium]
MDITYRTINQVRDRVEHLANIFLPDGYKPFVDVFARVHARRELRRLIDEAVVKLQRSSWMQVVELLFYGNSRLVRKIATIYSR